MDPLVEELVAKIGALRSLQDDNQRGLLHLQAKVGQLYETAIVDGKLTLVGSNAVDGTKGRESWQALVAENEALNQVVRQQEVAMALLMDKLRIQKLQSTADIGDLRSDIEEVMVLQEQEITALRLENARLKERLAKAEERIVAAFVEQDASAADPTES